MDFERALVEGEGERGKAKLHPGGAAAGRGCDLLGLEDELERRQIGTAISIASSVEEVTEGSDTLPSLTLMPT